jgi:nitrous oxide reductase accessory protein NosL
MKTPNLTASITLAIALAVVSLAGCAQKKEPEAAAKPYPLQTCLVCGMKLGDMGKPYVFVYQGQEIKVCDKSEKADFDKDPNKYLKKLADADSAPKK